jgi:hypothetical protein
MASSASSKSAVVKIANVNKMTHKFQKTNSKSLRQNESNIVHKIEMGE